MRSSLLFEVEDTDSLIAIDFLVDSVELSKSRLKKLMGAGGVWLFRDGQEPLRLRRAMTDLRPGDRVGVNYDAARLDQPVRRAELLRDETLYSLWHKPSGVLMHGDWWSDHNSLVRQVTLAFRQERPVWLLPELPGAGRGVVLAMHHRRAVLAFERLGPEGGLQLVLRCRLKGVTPAGWQHRGPAITQAAEDAGLELVLHEVRPVRNYPDDSELDLTVRTASLVPLVDWAARLDLTFGGFGEDVPAADLALNLDRDQLLEEEHGGPEGQDQFGLVQLDLMGMEFRCPFSGQPVAVRL